MNLFDPKAENPITVTEKAASWIGNQLTARGKGLGIRLGVKPGGCTGWEYVIEYVDHQLIEDKVINDNGITLFVDPKSLVMLFGSIINVSALIPSTLSMASNRVCHAFVFPVPVGPTSMTP